MAKMTKTQMKRALVRMRNKAFDLVKPGVFTVSDYAAISKIVKKAENKLK